MNVWVTAMDVMKIIAVRGFAIDRKIGRRITAMRFVWIPGRMPVIVPAIIPKIRARIIWNINFINGGYLN